jgi:DNA-binding NtrC family response regulator
MRYAGQPIEVARFGLQGLFRWPDSYRYPCEKAFFPWVILDLRLPDRYGSEVLSQIKTISPETQVIILTGHGTEKDRQQCMALGAHSFMNKPLDIDRLLAIMARIKKKPS